MSTVGEPVLPRILPEGAPAPQGRRRTAQQQADVPGEAGEVRPDGSDQGPTCPERVQARPGPGGFTMGWRRRLGLDRREPVAIVDERGRRFARDLRRTRGSGRAAHGDGNS
ncbi:MAG: hypothetical protein M5U07_15510 [Xanthobacteraceae bacterium]|nr:hypothetical protein [Xanthobacteraceae bacterium]